MSVRHPIDDAADAINALLVERHTASAGILRAEAEVSIARAHATDVERRMQRAQLDHAQLVVEARATAAAVVAAPPGPKHTAVGAAVGACFCTQCKAERAAVN